MDCPDWVLNERAIPDPNNICMNCGHLISADVSQSGNVICELNYPKELCKFRQKISLPEPIYSEMKLMHLMHPHVFGEFTGVTKDFVCTHENAPFTVFCGVKDNYLCDVCVRDRVCPLGIGEEMPYELTVGEAVMLFRHTEKKV